MFRPKSWPCTATDTSVLHQSSRLRPPKIIIMVRTRDFDGGAAADDEASVVANQTLVVALIASHQ